jgi:cell division protein FtsB
MSATRSYAPSYVDDSTAPPPGHRRPDRPPASGFPDEVVRAPLTADPEVPPGPPTSGSVDLTGLSVAGITRRRVGWVSAGLVAAWIVVVFARQVGDAQAATNQATQLASDNQALATEVQALQTELDLVVQPDYVAMEARGVRMGNPREIPFTLDPSIGSPVDGAPGSASVRLGATSTHETPLESWLQLLFGPSR